MRSTVVAMTAILATYGSALLVERLAGLRLDFVIQAIVLAMTLARIQRSADLVDRLASFVLLPAVAVIAWGIGHLMSVHADAGDVLFVVAMSASIWVRRFGPRASRAGLLIVSPLIAILIVGAGGHGQAGIGWIAVVALIACIWVTAAGLLAVRTGFAAPARQPGEVTATGGTTRAGAASAQRRGRRLPASTRMALQLGAALAAAFVIGRSVWPEHWTWVVLTAFIVCSGARGRGDVLLKGALRAAGAAAGTLVAAGIAGTLGPRSDATVVLMFLALAAATWLREYSYAYWAGLITAVLSLLYGWFGEAPGGLLEVRLCGILVGAALGIAASWLILPVRTGDVLRRRTADAVAAIGAVIGTDQADLDAMRRSEAAFEQSVARLGQIAQPLRAQRLLLSPWRPGTGYGADAIDAIAGCAEPVRAFARAGTAGDEYLAGHIKAVRANVTAARLAIGRRPGTPYRPASLAPPAGRPADRQVVAALCDIDGALGTVSAVFARDRLPRLGSSEIGVAPGFRPPYRVVQRADLSQVAHVVELTHFDIAHPRDPLIALVISAASSFDRTGRPATMTCSSSAWAPPPTAPSPSSVGQPMPAVKFPSEAPPTAAPRTSMPILAPIAWARPNRSAAAAGSSGGRLGPPSTSRRAPGTVGVSPRISSSTLSCAATFGTRTSTSTLALAGTVLPAVPADIRVGVTVVP
jgi:Fusaric acid resistance protein-like